MASPGGGGALFYTPEPHERPYYDGLFQAADIQRTGTIGGQDAVAFFSRSKLPMEQLKNVWTVADNPPSNSLNRPKFAVAIRLIQLLQNGVKGQGTSLAVPPGTPLRPVFLEGISGAVVPLPGAPQQQNQPPPQHPSPTGPQGMPPGPQQQQQQPATTPPQQQQQPTPPPPAQQQQPPGGGRPPMVPQSPSNAGSMALTVQDPYTLVPNERARYESIFPQYAKEDGYMHGKEAVALFSKSGLSQPQLRDIWNMADQPVDNKLDKLEFAIAMHLIVCVSKKNLPMPTSLPFSLKSLKQQQDQQQQQQQPDQQQQPPGSPAQQPPGGGGPAAYGQPTMPEPPQANRMTTPTTDVGTMPGGMPPSGMQGPPPIAQAGGMDISDAFEGLSTSDGMGGGGLPPPTSGFGGGGYGAGAAAGGVGAAASASTMEPSPKMEPTMAPSMPSPPRMHHEAPQPTIAAPSMPEPPKTSETLANSYNMSDNTGELEKLRTVLQKLQAENISLKAQLGTMSEEEKDVQREINATVAEIGDLSNRLTTLRAQVLASKSRLMEATAELKAAQEKKGVLNDLIGEAQATKDAIDSAYDGLEATVNAAQAPPAAPPAPAPAPTFEADLFGFGPPGGHLQAPPTTAPSHHANAAGGQQAVGSAPAPGPAPIPYGQHDPSGIPGAPPGQAHSIETVSSVDTSDNEQEDVNADPQSQGGQQVQMFGDYSAPAAAAPHQQNPYGGQEFSNPPPAAAAPHQQNPYGGQEFSAYGQEAPNAQQGISFEQGFRPNPGPHHRQSSISSNLSFEVMGGGPVPQNQFAPPQHQEESQFAHQQHQEDNAPMTNDDAEVVLATSMEEVNALKSKAKEAEDLSRDSETTLRHLMKKADKLRSAADKAEVEARQKMAEATEPKKKGILGGKKKKSMKEATAAKHDAEAKKKQFLAAQAQANDAQAVAMETKREADKLRKQAEQAELDAAAAASMQQKQPEPEPAPAPPMQAQPPHPNGYPAMGVPPSTQSYGQFNPAVMGQPAGGIDIPSPAAQAAGGAAADPYASYDNPF